MASKAPRTLPIRGRNHETYFNSVKRIIELNYAISTKKEAKDEIFYKLKDDNLIKFQYCKNIDDKNVTTYELNNLGYYEEALVNFGKNLEKLKLFIEFENR